MSANGNISLLRTPHRRGGDIFRSYKENILAAKDIRGLIEHEIAHAITLENRDFRISISDFEDRVKEESFVKGISGYADDRFDGFESIAEAFVRRQNGEKLSDEAKIILENYIDSQKR